MAKTPGEITVNVLIRPIVSQRYTTIDWEELSEMADKANVQAAVIGDYAAGVRDALRWLTTGIPTAELIKTLGGR